jgi:4-oxalocrotonate tautomerase
MPLARISVGAGLLSPEQRSTLIAEVTDALVKAEGNPKLRPYTYVIIDEVPDGNWGANGAPVTRASVAAALR